MADWYGHARSNYFRVKDADKFKAAIEALNAGISIWEQQPEPGPDEPTLFALGVTDGDKGNWPTLRYDESDQEHEVDVVGLVSEHLDPGYVAVFMECGAEKLRYLTGFAVAVNSKGERREVSIHDIYAKAAELAVEPEGVVVTPAEY